ncbi:MAG: polysaccharide lyase family 7 protein [Planctomycetota bacterium]
MKLAEMLIPPLVACLLPVLLITPSVHGEAVAVPYDLEKFRAVLDDSKLQAPTSSPTMIEKGQFEGQSNQYFFLDETGRYMTFTVTGDSKRSELRQLSGDWHTSTSEPRRLIARVRLLVPEDKELNQFTFMQIHDKKNGDRGLNKPLIRLTWRRSRGGIKDHLWAAVRIPDDSTQPISLENLATNHVDLGPRPEDFFDAEIQVHNSRMTVKIHGRVKLDMDVSYWDGLNNYFKAGVYNQDPGTSRAEFETLRYAATAEDAVEEVHVEVAEAGEPPVEEPE